MTLIWDTVPLYLTNVQDNTSVLRTIYFWQPMSITKFEVPTATIAERSWVS